MSSRSHAISVSILSCSTSTILTGGLSAGFTGACPEPILDYEEAENDKNKEDREGIVRPDENNVRSLIRPRSRMLHNLAEPLYPMDVAELAHSHVPALTLRTLGVSGLDELLLLLALIVLSA